MINLDLQPNESVILESQNICAGGFMSSYTDELYLTNINIIYVSKNLFGKVKGIEKYELSQIKLYDSVPQVKIGKNSNGIDELQIYFNAFQKAFLLQSGKREILKWVGAIDQTITGNKKPIPNNKHVMAIPGTEQVAETIRDTIGKFKSTIGITPKVENITIQCERCGATLSGEKGTVVCCDYCDTKQKL